MVSIIRNILSSLNITDYIVAGSFARNYILKNKEETNDIDIFTRFNSNINFKSIYKKGKIIVKKSRYIRCKYKNLDLIIFKDNVNYDDIIYSSTLSFENMYLDKDFNIHYNTDLYNSLEELLDELNNKTGTIIERQETPIFFNSYLSIKNHIDKYKNKGYTINGTLNENIYKGIKYKPLIEKYNNRLKNIGSKRKAEDFYNELDYEKSKGNIDYYVNRSLLLNFKEGGHGCRFNCPYCSFRTNKLMLNKQVPSLNDIDNFLKDYTGFKVYICGGGDPLYNYEENKEELNSILDHLLEEGYLIRLITREYRNALKIATKIDQFNFSTDILDNNVLECCKEVKRINPNCDIRISTVYDSTKDISFYKNYIEFYGEYVENIYIREDYNTKNFNNIRKYLLLNEMRKNNKYRNKIILFKSEVCDISYYLVGNKTMTGNEIFSAENQIELIK